MADDLDRYVCGMDKQTEEQALKELNENPTERVAAMKALRDWILQQKDWLKCPTDSRHLLMFLRPQKFAQLPAREKVVKYFLSVATYPQWFENLDARDPKLEQIFKDGIFIALPGYDSQGRRIAINRWGAVDHSNKRYTAEDIGKAFVIFQEYLLMDEQTQVTGVLILEDMTGYTLQHTAYIGIERARKQVQAIINAFPLRFKGLHIYNNNPVFEVFFSAVKPFLSKKIGDRIQVHGKSLATVYDHIEKKTLPVEYLPDDYTGPNAGTIQQCIGGHLVFGRKFLLPLFDENYWMDLNGFVGSQTYGIGKDTHKHHYFETLSSQDNCVAEYQTPEVRDYILKKSNSGFGVDESKKPPDTELFNESFRKLTVD